MTPQPTERPMADVIAEGRRLLDACEAYNAQRTPLAEPPFGPADELSEWMWAHGPALLALAEKGLEAEQRCPVCEHATPHDQFEPCDPEGSDGDYFCESPKCGCTIDDKERLPATPEKGDGR